MNLDTPIERWAAVNPRARWPLVLLAIFVLYGLACGLDNYSMVMR